MDSVLNAVQAAKPIFGKQWHWYRRAGIPVSYKYD